MTVVSQINGIDNRKHDICRDDLALPFGHRNRQKKSAKGVRWHVTPLTNPQIIRGNGPIDGQNTSGTEQNGPYPYIPGVPRAHYLRPLTDPH